VVELLSSDAKRILGAVAENEKKLDDAITRAHHLCRKLGLEQRDRGVRARDGLAPEARRLGFLGDRALATSAARPTRARPVCTPTRRAIWSGR